MTIIEKERMGSLYDGTQLGVVGLKEAKSRWMLLFKDVENEELIELQHLLWMNP